MEGARRSEDPAIGDVGLVVGGVTDGDGVGDMRGSDGEWDGDDVGVVVARSRDGVAVVVGAPVIVDGTGVTDGDESMLTGPLPGGRRP